MSQSHHYFEGNSDEKLEVYYVTKNGFPSQSHHYCEGIGNTLTLKFGLGNFPKCSNPTTTARAISTRSKSAHPSPSSGSCRNPTTTSRAISTKRYRDMEKHLKDVESQSHHYFEGNFNMVC